MLLPVIVSVKTWSVERLPPYKRVALAFPCTRRRLGLLSTQ
jgi:hypothetical protein